MLYILANVLFVVLSYVLLGFFLGVATISKFKEDYLTALGKDSDLDPCPRCARRIQEIEVNGLPWDWPTARTFLDYVGDIMANPLRLRQMEEPILRYAREVRDDENNIFASYPKFS